MVECRYTLGDEERALFLCCPPAILQVPLIEPFECTWRPPGAPYAIRRPTVLTYLPYAVDKGIIYYRPADEL